MDVVGKLHDIMETLADFYDVVNTQERANTEAAANIVIENGVVLAKNVPVSVLLFLEKQLVDLHTFVANLPVLPADRQWTWDSNRNCFVTDSTQTLKTQKVPQVIVKYDATKEHPAQTEMFTKDIVVGEYATTYMSSALPAERRDAALARIITLQEAVKVARQEANSIEVVDAKIGKDLLDYVFGEITQRVQS